MTGGKRARRGHAFVNAIVAVCILVSLGVTAAVVYEYHRLGQVMPAGVVTALLGLWGGELLIAALRQVLGRDVVARRREADESGREDGAPI